jgi:hypothetical protein
MRCKVLLVSCFVVLAVISNSFADTRANFKTPPFIQFLRQAKILILRIPNVCLRLKFLPSLNLNKMDHFENGSQYLIFAIGAIDESPC